MYKYKKTDWFRFSLYIKLSQGAAQKHSHTFLKPTSESLMLHDWVVSSLRCSILTKTCNNLLWLAEGQMGFYRRRGRWHSTRPGERWGWGSRLVPRSERHRTSPCRCHKRRSDMVLVSTHPGPQTPGRPRCSWYLYLLEATWRVEEPEDPNHVITLSPMNSTQNCSKYTTQRN